MKYSILLSAAVAIGAVAVVGMTSVHATKTTSDCVSGSTRDNFVSTWQGHDTISVKTRSGKPVCKDVVMFFSSYTLPAGYNGEKFGNNPTAYPQQQFDSKKFMIAKGENKSEKLSVKLPDLCNNAAQVDVYLGPEIKVVGAEGHQGRGIKGTNGNNHIVPKSAAADCEEPPVEEPKDEEPVAELPKTGSESVLGAGLLVSILTAGAAYLLRR